MRKFAFSLLTLGALALSALTLVPSEMITQAFAQSRQTVDIEVANGKVQFRTTQGLFDMGTVNPTNRRVQAPGVLIPVAAPASASAPCSPGQFAVSTNAIHVCTASNTWKSAALGTFSP